MTKWPLVSLSELLALNRRPVKLEAEREYAEIGIYCFGRGIFHKLPRTGIQVGDKSLFMIREGDFILQITFAWEGAVALASAAEDGMFASTRYPTFRVDVSRCHPQFLVEYFRTSQGTDQLVKVSPGSAGRNRVLSLKRLNEVLVPLPPIEEQRRIVERIEELTRSVNSLEKLARTAVEEKGELFSRIVSEVSDRLIQSHKSEPLEALTTFIGDMNHEMPAAVEIGVPFISPKDFATDWTIDFNGAKHISPDDFARQAVKCKPQTNDILMARYGTIGAARLVDTDAEFLASYSIAVIRPDSRRVLPRFLFWMVTSRHIQEQATQGIRGSGMADLGLKTIRRFMIPTVGLDEQAMIVKRLDDLRVQTSRLCKHSATALDEIRSLIPSVLNSAFSGQL